MTFDTHRPKTMYIGTYKTFEHHQMPFSGPIVSNVSLIYSYRHMGKEGDRES